MNSQIGKALSKAVPAGVFSSPGILSPPSLPTPASRRMGGGKVLGAEGAPASGLTFHAHAVVKAFVVQASVVGRAEMLPEVAAGPCPHGKHMRSAVPSRRPLPPCRADAPCRPIHAPAGQEIHHLHGGAAPGRVDHLVHKPPSRNHQRMSWPRSPEGGRLRP